MSDSGCQSRGMTSKITQDIHHHGPVPHAPKATIRLRSNAKIQQLLCRAEKLLGLPGLPVLPLLVLVASLRPGPGPGSAESFEFDSAAESKWAEARAFKC